MLKQIEPAIRAIIDLQSEVSELCEKVMWLSRVDLPGFDEEKLNKVSHLYNTKRNKLDQMKEDFFS